MRWVERWYVRSFTNAEKEYTVARDEDGGYGCSCPAWKFQRHRIRDGICKHIRQIKGIVEEEQREQFIERELRVWPDNVTHDDFFTEEEFAL